MLQCLLVALVVDFPVQETVVCEQSWYWRCPFQIPIPDGGWCRPWRVLVLGLFLVALQKWLGWCPNAPLWQWLLWCALPETSQSSIVLDLELHSAVAWWCGAYVRLRQRPCWSRVGCNRSVSRCLGISDSPVRWRWWKVVGGEMWIWGPGWISDANLMDLRCESMGLDGGEVVNGWRWDKNIVTWISLKQDLGLRWCLGGAEMQFVGTGMQVRHNLVVVQRQIYGPGFKWPEWIGDVNLGA